MSSWLTTWRTSPFLKSRPASLHGMCGSSLDSKSNKHRTRTLLSLCKISVKKENYLHSSHAYYEQVLPGLLLTLGRPKEAGTSLNVIVPSEFFNICNTSSGVFPSTFNPFTSTTSSPGNISPDLSAAPPCITRAIVIFPVSSSFLIVAPCRTQNSH